MFVTISLLLAAACLVPAAAKLAGHPKMRHAATHFGIAWRRYRLIGVAELAAAGMFLLLIGALISHRRAHDSIREALPALLALVISGTYLAAAQ